MDLLQKSEDITRWSAKILLLRFQKERPEGFVEKIWSFVPTFGTVSTEMKHTQIISKSYFCGFGSRTSEQNTYARGFMNYTTWTLVPWPGRCR